MKMIQPHRVKASRKDWDDKHEDGFQRLIFKFSYERLAGMHAIFEILLEGIFFSSEGIQYSHDNQNPIAIQRYFQSSFFNHVFC